ncbi:MAG: HAD-IA family hydrolase [Gammaproteobacteria bacterium]
METGKQAIVGSVRTGAGQGASFTALPWADRQFRELLGIAPFPGTLNLQASGAALEHWQMLRKQPGLRIAPGTPDACAAICYPVRVSAGSGKPITAAVVVPDVAAYPPDQMEILAAVPLRQALSVANDDLVVLESVPALGQRAVLFDVDGTLVNSIDGYRLAAERAVQPFGWTVPADAVRRSLNFGESFWDLVIPSRSRGDKSLAARLRRDTMAHWPAILEESVQVYPSLADVLTTLRAAGFRLGICTASQGESFLPLERAGLLGHFDAIVTALDVQRRKPDPEGLLLCMERMGVTANNAVYVGDSVADVEASHAAGVCAIAVLTGAGTSDLLSSAGAHRILADLNQLPGLFTALPQG